MKKRELLKEIKLVNKELNHIYNEDGIVSTIKLVKNEYDEDIIRLELKDEFDDKEIITCDCLYDEGKNIDALIYELIKDVYENNVNHLAKYIKATKVYNARKIKSLALWKSRNKQDKVDEIINELIERHENTERAKCNLVEPKELIRNLYLLKSKYTEGAEI